MTIRDLIFFIIMGLWFISGIVGTFCMSFGITWVVTFLFFSGIVWILILITMLLISCYFKSFRDFLDREII